MSEYRPQSRDTSIEAERLQVEAIRRMPVAERGERFRSLCRAAESLAIEGIRRRHPNAPEHEIRMRLAALRYGEETMIRVFGWDPSVRGW